MTDALATFIDGNLLEEEKIRKVTIILVPSCYNPELEKAGLVEFHGGVPGFLSKLKENPLAEWQVEVRGTDVNFDQHFFGFTQLYVPSPEKPVTAEYASFQQGMVYSG